MLTWAHTLVSMWAGLPHSMAIMLQAGMSWEGGLESKYSKRTGQKPYNWPWKTQHHFCHTCWGGHKLVQGQIQEKGMWTNPTPRGGSKNLSPCFKTVISVSSWRSGQEKGKMWWMTILQPCSAGRITDKITGVALRHFITSAKKVGNIREFGIDL